MNCNVHVFCKLIFSNKLGFILETSLFLYDENEALLIRSQGSVFTTLYFFHNLQMGSVIVPSRSFQPSLMFVGKARSLP